MFQFKYICVFAILNVIFVSCEHNVVETTHGKISGKVFTSLYKNEEYFGFIGIPYAAPPVKEFKFLPPQPLEPWNDILNATKEKKPCVQFNNNIKKKQRLGVYGSEDCLYLDIFTPKPDDSKRSVIMFIYNINFVNSYNKTKDYQPDFFIEEDVVVVTIAHRLSALGFLSLEDESLWGNAGLKDIVAGLEWVRENIEKFGGDKDKITLMGLQGGAAAVDLLLHSKKKDLFNQAILQSGNARTTAILQENVRERAYALAKLFDKNPVTSKDVITELKEIPVANIVSRETHASPDDYFKDTQRSVVAFAPIVEKDPEGLIVDYPEKSTEISKPIMIGFNSQEGLDASLQYLLEPKYIHYLKKDFPLLLPVRSNFTFDPRAKTFKEAIKEIKNLYFNGKINLDSVKDFVSYIGDVAIAYSTDYTAKTYAKISKSPIYYYLFDYISELNENSRNLKYFATVDDVFIGAATGDEMCYLFKCPDLVETYLKYGEGTEQRVQQMKLVKLWSNFAKYGNPTPAGDDSLDGLNWPNYSDNGQYLHIENSMQIKKELYKNKFQFWDEFVEKWGQRATDGVITESMNTKDEL